MAPHLYSRFHPERNVISENISTRPQSKCSIDRLFESIMMMMMMLMMMILIIVLSDSRDFESGKANTGTGR